MMNDLDLVYMKWYREFLARKKQGQHLTIKIALEALNIDPNNAIKK